MGYRVVVHEDRDGPGVSHPIPVSTDDAARRSAQKWLDVINYGGRVVVERNGERIGCWVVFHGEDIWTG